MDPPAQLDPESVRGTVLKTLAHEQAQWSAPQLAVRTGLTYERVQQALNWLREHRYCDLAHWMGRDSLYAITPDGRELLAAGAQLALDVS